MADRDEATTDVVRARLAAVEAVAERWSEVLDEAKAADPRWILDRSVTILDSALNELGRALGPHNPPVQPGGVA